MKLPAIRAHFMGWDEVPISCVEGLRKVESRSLPIKERPQSPNRRNRRPCRPCDDSSCKFCGKHFKPLSGGAACVPAATREALDRLPQFASEKTCVGRTAFNRAAGFQEALRVTG